MSFEKNFYRLPFTPPSLVHRIGPSKAMVMTLYMSVVKQHSQHIMTPAMTIYMTLMKQLTLTTKHKTV
jgi:hypothetical protein